MQQVWRLWQFFRDAFMNRRLGRLFLAGACCLSVVTAARAQHGPFIPPPPRMDWIDDAPRPSHRPLDNGFGDLSQAENRLSHRLNRTHNLQDLQDLIQPLRDNPELLKQFKKDMRPEDVQRLLDETIKNNPSLLDDPKLGELLKQADKIKAGDQLGDDKTKELQKLAKDFFDQHKQDLPPEFRPGDRTSSGPPPDLSHSPEQPPHTPPPSLTPPSLPPKVPPPPAKPSWLSREVLDGMAGIVKDADKSGDGEALRTLIHEFGKGLDSGGDNSLAKAMSSLPKGWFTSDDASWLANNLKPPSPPNVGGNWSGGPAFTSGGLSGGDSAGALEAVIWVAALGLIAVAVWMAVSTARRQAADARKKGWELGPWPVSPSQVSTREDLIRAFEYLAFLLLGPSARTLNHLDVAERLRPNDGLRAGAAARLAHLYEQARYAPADESLPPEDLMAARGDLSALAGAAA